MTTTQSLSVIIPAYCEADNILGTLINVTTALAPLPIEAEILGDGRWHRRGSRGNGQAEEKGQGA